MSSDYIIVGGELYHADDFLAHYGVKGMKWGVRKEDRQARKEHKKKLKQYNKEYRQSEREHRKILRQYKKDENRHKRDFEADQKYRDESGRLNAEGKKRFQYGDTLGKGLTPEGEAYIRKYAPLTGINYETNRRLPTAARDAVVNKFNKEYWDTLNKAAKKAGLGNEFEGDGAEASYLVGSKVLDDMQNRYDRAYSEATLKDLGFDVSERAILYCTSRYIM